MRQSRKPQISSSGYQSEQLRASRVTSIDRTDLTQTNPSDEFLKAGPAGRRGPTDAEIGIDNVNIGFMPAKFTSALAERVL
jgi:hypothetical protein